MKLSKPKSPKINKGLRKYRKEDKLTDEQVDMLLRCDYIDQAEADALKKIKGVKV